MEPNDPRDLAQPTALSEPDRNKLEQAAASILQVLEKTPSRKEEGYYPKSRIFGNKVYVYLMHGPELVSSGFANIREGEADDRSMAQAFSYAAHMAFKHCQWKDAFPEEK